MTKTAPKPCLGYRSRSAAVRALQADGKSNAEIAAMIGIPVKTICALGGKPEMPLRRLSEEAINDIIERRERGWGYDQLAERHGVSPGAIHYQCLKHGAVSPRQRVRPVPTEAKERIGRDGRVQRCFTVAEDKQLIALESQGLSYSEISRRTGRAYTSVRIRLMSLAMREELPA